ncbi:MAG: hypothetical protein ROZ09_04525 [Thiobacillus sp.]|uniref:hypothetical protein n=1 Tax=Thiobacillus sp. TaxID=924 RepID=UPI0028956CEB|nr:hypothetical protein [Thiobacillus sp.]MDT3706067.1 hypothetical protein [Thiobacillus sp.]
MNLVGYLNRKLKDDAVIGLLEHYDMEVIYEFDRLHENTADAYSSAAKDAGFELRFNEQQVLETIWCYVKERDGFMAVDSGILGVPCYSSFAEAVNSVEARHLRLSKPSAGSEAWIRMEEKSIWRHYEFLDGELALLTLMLPWE